MLFTYIFFDLCAQNIQKYEFFLTDIHFTSISIASFTLYKN